MQRSLLFENDPSPLPAVRDRLRATFGLQRDIPNRDPVSTLVRAILGSRTYDAVSESVFARLKERYPGWRGLMTAPIPEIEAAIAQVTFPDVKAPCLAEALQIVEERSGTLSLDFLAELSSDEALAWLERIKGVGRKISASVLNFSTLKGYAFVIDTHLLRVGWRLGWIPRKAKTAEQAYEPYMALMPELWRSEDLRELHLLLKRLGQTICRHDEADCQRCPLSDFCPTGRRRCEASTSETSPEKADERELGCIDTALAPFAPSARLAGLHAKVAKLARSTAQTAWGVLSFGDGRVDTCFPQGGLPLGRWHEIAGEGLERELPAAGAAFAAALARRIMGRDGVVVWVLRRDDLHAPGLPGFSVDPGRLIFVHAEKDADVLNAMEAALRTCGVSAVVAEAETVDLAAGKRLQLACEQGGATGLLIRRRIFGAPRRNLEPRAEGSAATTRWRISSSPTEPDEPGLGLPRWSVRLERCRGGRPGAWIMEADDATSHVRVVAELADHATEAGDWRKASGA